MQQVVLFSLDFTKESEECLSNDLKKVEGLVESNDQSSAEEIFNAHFKTPYERIKIDVSEPPTVVQDILASYKGLNLGLPEEWFHLKDRIDVHIWQKNIKIEGNPSSFLFMPKGGTPVRLIINKNYANGSEVTIYCITNINYGNQESVIAFEQSCDEKLVRVQGNINLLNAEIKSFNDTYRSEIIKRINEVKQSVSENIAG